MVVLTVVAGLLLNADTGWSEVSKNDGYRLEQRPVAGSAYFEYRVTTDTDLPVLALCDGVYDWGTLSKDHDLIKARQLLSDEKDVRVVYDQIRVPGPVAPRDVAYAVRRERHPDGSCTVDIDRCDDARVPPTPKGWVRMPKLRGRWLFEPSANGTHVTYTLFSDPGGALPAGIVHASQREAAVNTVKKGIRVARDHVSRAER